MRISDILLTTGLLLIAACGPAPAALPDAVKDEAKVAGSANETVVLAGGCFWGIEGVFEHVRGVTKAVSGYAGGRADTATYEQVSTGTTGHAESVEVTYDPAQVSLGQLLKIYFSVAHNPTELNRQGPDHGTQYRSAVFVTTPDQQQVATAYISQLDAAHSFDAPIVTTVGMLDKFYPAEAYHQDYLRQHPLNPYIVINDAPKVAALKSQFASLYKE